ncbi:carbon-nitrogen hydrolase family protein [Paenibacillus sp. HB172176]|uniref:carbon-nitrogen hydrolase family protein n=1 Tax=Paenibacillus sp. HB172176 TaxID=2493690 RepID=UPI00143C9BEF|nr:carbon-nitrogen hydrolase family protein [Paenibacillus sp. HB172176]
MRFRTAAVQYKLTDIDSFAEFEEQVTHSVRNASEYGVQFLLFPEFLTTQLLSISDENGNPHAFEQLPSFTEAYLALFTKLAEIYQIYIIGGTHVRQCADGSRQNVAHLFHPDGKVDTQGKVHLTPTEVEEWNMSPADGIEVFQTHYGKIAMLTCYDIEFPELVRIVRSKGADVIFCPSCTDDRHGFYRVRYCCHARTVENQMYVVTTGTVGSLRKVDFMRANFGQAAIIAPNDIPFPPGGIIAEGLLNDDMLVVGDLDLQLLDEVRKNGSVRPWLDRRPDIYPTWK